MNKFTRALVLGLATSAFALAGCATTNSGYDCDTKQAASDCDDSKASSDCLSEAACVDCTDPNCEKCDIAKDCVDCGGPSECAKCAAKAASTDAVNANCPISGNPVSADVQTVSFQGQEIGFCCGGCVGKFANLTDTEKAAKLHG